MDFIENIKQIPITDYASKIGFNLVKKGSKYVSLKEHDSVMIDTEKNCFWRNSTFSSGRKGGAGSVIDFVMEFKNLDRNKALRELAVMYDINKEKKINESNIKKIEFAKSEYDFNKKSFEGLSLPEPNKTNKNAYSYLLKRRCIDKKIIDYFLMKKMLYQDVHNNCVFVTNKFACLRSTGDKRYVLDIEGSDYNECFLVRNSKNADTLVVTESVIDIMSIMTELIKRNHNYTNYDYLSLSGTNKIQSVSYHLKNYKKICLALDNDEAGRKAEKNIIEDIKNSNHECKIYKFNAPEEYKDWNEYIVASYQENEKEKGMENYEKKINESKKKITENTKMRNEKGIER